MKTEKLMMVIAVIAVIVLAVGGYNYIKGLKVNEGNEGNAGAALGYGDCTSMLNATNTTAEALSNWHDVTGADKISFFFTRDNHSAGSTEFVIYTSPVATTTNSDGSPVDTEWSDVYERLILNDDMTDSANMDRVASATLSAAGVEQYFVDHSDFLGHVLASISIDTDGSSDVYLCKQF